MSVDLDFIPVLLRQTIKHTLILLTRMWNSKIHALYRQSYTYISKTIFDCESEARGPTSLIIVVVVGIF